MASDGEASGQDKLSRVNTNIPHPARVYDAWLGGKDNFAADRAAAEAGLQAFPSTVKSVRANRAFLARTVEYLVAEAGIRQFLDIGTGLPSANNTHEVAQAIAPESRIVYVDNDPIVLVHAEALLKSSGAGATDYIDADLRDPARILQEASRTLDFTQPVAVMLIAVLHFVSDEADPYKIVDTLMAAVPPGSHLVASHTAKDIFPEEMAAFERAMNEKSAEKVTLRDREQVTGFFRGLDLVEPGVVEVPRWRPRSDLEASAPAALWGGVARKPA
ncbi:SAM-dependent methyltransferase [Actinomadura geliboluensis]|uniref:SAM-dependent methyltransferase n=1 Tax=Actinomadura geliboluensis TaxID=882440 RepID=UPI0036AC7968